MSRFQDLCVRVLARCGVNPMAGDLTSEVVTWPTPVAASRSPYDCEPTSWGVENLPAPGPASTAQKFVSSTRRCTGRKARRLKFEVDREPTPRGLLVS